MSARTKKIDVLKVKSVSCEDSWSKYFQTFPIQQNQKFDAVSEALTLSQVQRKEEFEYWGLTSLLVTVIYMILHILYKIFKTDLHLLWHWQKRLDLQCYQTSLEWIVFFFPSSAIETCFWLFVIAWHNISVCQSQTKWAEGRRLSTRIIRI